MQATKVSLERFAEIRAEMEKGARRDEVLAREGIGLDEWASAQSEWLEKMSVELERDRFELTNRYGAAFVARQTALAKLDAPPPPQNATLPPPASPPPPLAASPLPLPPPAPSPVPSPPAARPQAPATAPLPPEIADLGRDTPLAKPSPLHQATPFVPSRTPSQSSFAAVSPPMPSSVPSPPTSSVPSAPGSQVRSASPVGMPKAAVNPRFSETMGPLEAIALPLPFVGQAAQKPPKALETTLNQPSPIPRAALPFQPGAAPPAIAKPQGSGPPPPPPKSVASGSHNDTSAPLPSPIKPVLPFHQQGKTETPALTMEQHASLHAELLARPGELEGVLKKYGITAETKASLDVYWKRRCGAEPSTLLGWEHAFKVYGAWLAEKKGR